MHGGKIYIILTKTKKKNNLKQPPQTHPHTNTNVNELQIFIEYISHLSGSVMRFCKLKLKLGSFDQITVQLLRSDPLLSLDFTLIRNISKKTSYFSD